MENALFEFLLEFHYNRDYFECHEILEERWKEDQKEERELHWVALIQIAVGFYHWRRENTSGAKKLLTRALEKVKLTHEPLTALGFEVKELEFQIGRWLRDIEKERPYYSHNLPMTHLTIENYFLYCESKGLVLGFMSSDPRDEFLRNKHMLREREIEE